MNSGTAATTDYPTDPLTSFDAEVREVFARRALIPTSSRRAWSGDCPQRNRPERRSPHSGRGPGHRPCALASLAPGAGDTHCAPVQADCVVPDWQAVEDNAPSGFGGKPENAPNSFTITDCCPATEAKEAQSRPGMSPSKTDTL